MLEQIQNGLADAVNMVITFVPLLLGFLAILFIGWIVAKLLMRATNAVLERVGFDRLVERGGVKRAMARTKYDASDILAKIVFYVVMLFVLQVAFGLFGANPVSLMLAGVIAYLPNVFAAILIVVVGAAIAAAVKEITSAALGGLPYGNALGVAASVAVLVVAGFAALDQLNIAPAIVTGLFYAILAAVVGVIIVAVGGAGVMPMRRYWDQMLGRMEVAAPQMRQAAQQAPQNVKQRAEERKEQARVMTGAGANPGF